MKSLLPLIVFFALAYGFSNKAHAQCKPIVTLPTDGRVLQTTEKYESYRWVTCPDFNDIPGAFSSSYYVVTPGSYAVIVTKGTCTDTSDCTFVNPTGINETVLAQQVSVTPNPSSGQVYLKAPVALQGAYVAVYSITGQMQTSFILGAEEESIILQPGWHFITVDKAGWRETHKVLIVE
ncbi:MAG TPA: T9SS type A sorting domain-containing protein [Chitinophagaceae bacterium]|nr:T9SS type A sorting domain-containing protein [Chitinophagaceae bacterium]